MMQRDLGFFEVSPLPLGVRYQQRVRQRSSEMC